MFDKVILNKYGFYQLRDIPDAEALQDYYAANYYQGTAGSYSIDYPLEEVTYIINKIQQKYSIIDKYIGATHEKKHLLDIGCGEGWALKFFESRDWDVLGLDYSEFGCKSHNPEFISKMIIGDIYASIDDLIVEGRSFDCIWLDNVLEHLTDPYDLLVKCRRLLNTAGVMVIEVPNDFSAVQKHLINNHSISEAFWVAEPDHISYFNREGLISICQDAGWQCIYSLGDFPIDFNLFNANTNYVNDRSKGKSCHQARIALENLFHSISVEKTNELYHVLSEMGLGRQIIAFFRLGE